MNEFPSFLVKFYIKRQFLFLKKINIFQISNGYLRQDHIANYSSEGIISYICNLIKHTGNMFSLIFAI